MLKSLQPYSKSYLKQYINRIYNHYNGKINTIVKSVGLEFNTRSDDILGTSCRSCFIRINLKALMKQYISDYDKDYDILDISLVCTKFKIIFVIIHELYHMDQYTKNITKEIMESQANYMTKLYIENNLIEINELLDVDFDITNTISDMIDLTMSDHIYVDKNQEFNKDYTKLTTETFFNQYFINTADLDNIIFNIFGNQFYIMKNNKYIKDSIYKYNISMYYYRKICNRFKMNTKIKIINNTVYIIPKFKRKNK